jgi:hypothetical protein
MPLPFKQLLTPSLLRILAGISVLVSDNWIINPLRAIPTLLLGS